MFDQFLKFADDAYRAGRPIMPDAIFDRLAKLGSLPELTGDLLSLDTPSDPADWMVEHEGPYFVQLKADGVSINLIYQDGVLVKAHLRGGREVTVAAIKANALTDLPGRPAGIVEVRGEVVSAKVSRNAVAAALRSGKVDGLDLHILAFDLVGIDGVLTHQRAIEWLMCAGFGVLRGEVVTDPVEVLEYADAFDVIRRDIDIPCDGITVKINNKQRQQELGNCSRAPRWAIAIKP